MNRRQASQGPVVGYGWVVFGAHQNGALQAGSLRTPPLLLNQALKAQGCPLLGLRRPGGKPRGRPSQDTQSPLRMGPLLRGALCLDRYSWIQRKSPRARLKMSKDRGCMTHRPHRHPKGLVQISPQLGPQAIGCPPRASPSWPPPLERKSQMTMCIY